LKYIIYRGILKSSILESDGVTFKNISDANNIVGAILENQQPDSSDYSRIGLATKPPNTPLQQGDIIVDDDVDLDLFFLRATDGEGRTVEPGMILGEFQASEFGIETIQESGWKRPKLGILRNVSLSTGNRITVNLANPPEKVRAEREKLLSYFDPVCLFSLFYQSGIDTTLGEKSAQPVYDDILSSFLNKNKVYLEIRNYNDFSLDFYDNTPDIFFKDSSDTTVSSTYNSSGWPIHIIDPAYIKSVSGDEKTQIPLAFPVTDNTANICFLVHAAVYKKGFLDFSGQSNHGIWIMEKT